MISDLDKQTSHFINSIIKDINLQYYQTKSRPIAHFAG